MVRRRSYLKDLNTIYINTQNIIADKRYIRFRQVVYLSTTFFQYTFLTRKRLLKKKHLNQYLCFNNVFYNWVFFYLKFSSVTKKGFLYNFTTTPIYAFDLLPLFKYFAQSFFILPNLHSTTFLVPKRQITVAS